MRDELTTLLFLAEGRRKRLGADGRPVFNLTADEVQASARSAMRLAEASKSQVEGRLSSHCARSA